MQNFGAAAVVVVVQVGYKRQGKYSGVFLYSSSLSLLRAALSHVTRPFRCICGKDLSLTPSWRRATVFFMLT